MNTRALFVAAASALSAGLMAAAAPAQAALAFDQDLAAPGVYFGTGNHNGHFTVDTDAGIEVALRAHVYQQDATSPVGALYAFNLGDVVSFDWSINPDVGQAGVPTPVAFSNAIITIHDFANNNTQVIPGVFPDFNTTTPLAPGAYQNSERLSFGFIDALYNANQNNTFSVNLTLIGPNSQTISVTEVIQQGAGVAVPEPATWALMILGFGGAGAALRSRRRAVAA